jgi:DNA (cytosine-5)-methyltransferase 1
LFNHEKGRTLQIIKEVIKDLGYTLVSSTVLKSMYFKVPQKRERLFLIGIRNDLLNESIQYQLPSPYKKVLTVGDAIYKGVLYDNDVPISEGDKYPIRKKEIMDLVPQGGFWKDLPIDIQKEYMGGSFYLGGGKTGLARRLSLYHPSLTLVCASSMKQTERCHPTETRPLTVRESGRIQTFPDDWFFCGPKSQQYKQIGNAVPVNLGWVVGLSVVRLLNQLD